MVYLHDLLVLGAWLIAVSGISLLLTGVICFAYYMIREVFFDGTKH